MNAPSSRLTGLSAVLALAVAVWTHGMTSRPAIGQAPAADAPGEPKSLTFEAAPPAVQPAPAAADPAGATSRPAAAAEITRAATAAVTLPLERPADVLYTYSPNPLMDPVAAGPESAERRQLREDSTRHESELGNLLKEYAAAADDAKTALRPRIEENLVRQFDARQKGRDLEIADLEAQVKRLRDLHQRREAAKTEIVDARLAQLLRSAEGLGWDGHEADEYGRMFPMGAMGGRGGVGRGVRPGMMSR